jgi:hypothetical protein
VRHSGAGRALVIFDSGLGEIQVFAARLTLRAGATQKIHHIQVISWDLIQMSATAAIHTNDSHAPQACIISEENGSTNPIGFDFSRLPSSGSCLKTYCRFAIRSPYFQLIVVQ